LALFTTPTHAPPQSPAQRPAEKDGPAVDFSSGDVIDGYRLVSAIGKGGFGVTWLAINETTGKQVAIKFVEGDEQLHQELAAMQEYVHVASRCEYLIQVEHINRDRSRLWIVTPLADSLTGAYTAGAYKPLSLQNQLQAQGHIPEKDAVGIAVGVVHALLTLHQAGLLHGDVSPPNILHMWGRWVLADPGLVRFIGQPGFCRDRRYYPQPLVVNPCDDLYALGITLWEMVSGVWEMVANLDRLKLDGKLLHLFQKKEPADGRLPAPGGGRES
jgi:serine/threonine protein kinase